MLWFLIFYITNAAITQDEVKVLPGWPNATLPSKHYSGLIDVGVETKSPGKLHYWFIESESRPSVDPIVLWLNGGPGSSSLIGCLTENGQMALNDDSLRNKYQGVPRLFYNPYSWNRKASVIFLESPKGVGFSYCNDQSNCRNTDETTAIDAHEFLVNFFKGFPEYANNDFFITGESYAGVYIPMLIDQIDRKGQITTFKGAAIGNGCWGSDCFYGMTERQIDSHIFAGHSLISQTLEAEITSNCEPDSWSSSACRHSLSKMDDQTGDFDIYNIYDVCRNDDHISISKIREIVRNDTILRKPSDSYHPHPNLKQLNDYKCGGSHAMDQYLDDPNVIKALHVKSGTGRMHYSSDCGDLRNLYKQLFQKHRIMIYSGDADACVPHWGSEKWTREMGFSVKKDWHPWMSDSMEHKGNVVAGYAIEYDSLTYVTIKGAGHMVPQFKPVFAQTMFEKFLSNSPF